MKDTTKTFVTATHLKPLNRILWSIVVLKDLISTRILIHFFFWEICPFFNLEIWPKLEILLKTVRQRSSTETAQQNFVKLCSYKGHKVKICIFTGNADLIFLRSNVYPFWTLAKIILCKSDKTGIISDCPSLMLGIVVFVVHSIPNQCWSVEYSSMLTLFFHLSLVLSGRPWCGFLNIKFMNVFHIRWAAI